VHMRLIAFDDLAIRKETYRPGMDSSVKRALLQAVIEEQRESVGSGYSSC
jgi:hypothetical protein